MLTGYAGDFVIAYRKNGTNLYRLDCIEDAANWSKQDHEKSIFVNMECAYTFLTNNDFFLFIDEEGTSKKITKDEAISYLSTRTKNALQAAKFFEDINLKMIAFELMTYIKYNSHSWKSRLKMEWELNSSTPALARLRNHFGHKLVFSQITLEDDEEKIFSLLADGHIREV